MLCESRVEAEYDRKLHEMRERHRRELADVEISATAAATTSVVAVEETEELETKVSNLQVVAAVTDGADGESAAVVAANEARERKLAKARRKRDKERAKELEREAAVAQELQSAGPSQRSVELQLIQSVLTPLHYQIGEIPADGHCLYRAVAAQTTTTYASTYQEIRTYYFCVGKIKFYL